MPRYEKDGQPAVETSNKVEGTRLRAMGYRETPAKTKAVKAADAAHAKGKDVEDVTTVR